MTVALDVGDCPDLCITSSSEVNIAAHVWRSYHLFLPG